MKRNGFVMIETLITVVILITALIAMYTLFSNMLVEEKRRVLYDDPRYVIRANYITELFKDKFAYASGEEPTGATFSVKLENMLTTYDGYGNPVIENIRAFSCDNDIFNNDLYNSKTDCNRFFYDQGIYRVYVMKSDLSFVDVCEDNPNLESCFAYKSLNKQIKRYLRTLSYTPGSNAYYLVFEFNEDKDGNICKNNNCLHEFATVKYGDTNEIINLNK